MIFSLFPNEKDVTASQTPKRLVFRDAPSEDYQQVVEGQYRENALTTIRQEFDRVLAAGSLNQQQVNAIIDPRIAFIGEVFGDDQVMHDNRNNIVRHLNELKSQILTQLTQLGETTAASREAVVQRNSARYQEFITFLQGRGVISQVPPRVETPAPRPTPPPTPQPSRETARREAIRWADESLRGATGETAAPSRETAPRPEPETVDPSRNLDLEWHDLSRSWTDIPTTFSESFFQRAFQVIPRGQWRPFLASGIDHPEPFHRIMQVLHRIFQAYARERGGNEVRLLPSFMRLLIANSVGDGMTLDPSLATLADRAERQVAAEVWREETLRDLQMPQRSEMLATLQRLEATLLRQEIPTAEDLQSLQRYVSFAERELFQGQQLTWRDLQQAEFRARDNVYILKGQRFPIRRVFSTASARTVETYSHTELVVNGSAILPFELPRLIETLRLCHRRFESTLRAAGGTINLASLATGLEAQPEALRLTQQREYFRSLTRTLSFERSPTFDEFPALLARGLGQYSPTEQKSAQEWTMILERQQLNPELNADAYRLLWLGRFYARTRNAGDGQMTMTQFAEQLLRSNSYLPTPDRPPQSKSDLMRTLASTGNIDENARNVLRIQRIEDEYEVYLERVPAIREIVAFEQSLADFERRIFEASLYQSNPPTDVSRARDSATRVNWPFMVGLLNTQEEVYLSSPDGSVRTGEGTNTVEQPLYDRDLAERYHRLKTSNAFFQDMVRMGEQSITTPERFTMRLGNIINRVLTPNAAVNE